jgi:hypothetical protein
MCSAWVRTVPLSTSSDVPRTKSHLIVFG